MNIKMLIKAAIFCACWPNIATAESAKGILPQSLILSLQVRELFDYRCPRNNQCRLKCMVDQYESSSFQNVRRAELAKGDEYWVFGAVHIDSLGKGHKSIGFVPEPPACVMGDLEFVATIPVVDGTLNSLPDEVIFDLSPSS
ncbi:MAG: hypothetical protein ACJAX5_001492 [Patiriisocius sp.]|jgi:hypothetical protein